MGERWSVGAGEVIPRRKVYKAKIDDELGNLKTGDPLLPRDLDTSRTLEIVPIHDDVYCEVESNGNPRDRGATNELSVAEKCSCGMMVAVQEG